MLKFVKIARDRTFQLMLPQRMTPESAGYDLQADLDEPFTLFPGESTVIPTGLRVGIPDGYQGLLFSRSGHGCVPTGVRAPNVKASNGVGVIDRDFRGELKVCLQNTGSVEKIINPGDRIAQLVLVQVYEGEAEWVASLDATERTGGFGSTGENIAKSNTSPTTVPFPIKMLLPLLDGQKEELHHTLVSIGRTLIAKNLISVISSVPVIDAGPTCDEYKYLQHFTYDLGRFELKGIQFNGGDEVHTRHGIIIMAFDRPIQDSIKEVLKAHGVEWTIKPSYAAPQRQPYDVFTELNEYLANANH